MVFKLPCAARSIFRSLKAGALILISAVSLLLPMSSAAQQEISKFLLIKMVRDTAGAMCTSEEFAQCMGFSQTQCQALNEKAIDTCFGPLPETINLEELENSTLEECPQQVYADAGFTEDKAKICFDKAMEALPAPGTEKPAENQ